MIRLLLVCILCTLAPALSAQELLVDAVPVSTVSPVIKSAYVPQMEITLSDFRYVADQSQPDPFQNKKKGILDLPRTKPGVAFLTSAILPGSGQALNGKWGRAAGYLAVDAVALILHLDRTASAQRQERAYERFSNQNWSVVAYADWLVDYSQANNLNNRWQELEQDLNGAIPDWNNTTNDWNKVDLDILRSVEVRTPFIFESGRIASEFSHNLPEYGSQQYYELISKYFQFQSGWQDFYNRDASGDNYRYLWNGQDLPNELFFNGRDQAERFNDNYRAAGNFLSLLIVNHVVSAFDAFFTVRLKNYRLQAEANLLRPDAYSITFHF